MTKALCVLCAIALCVVAIFCLVKIFEVSFDDVLSGMAKVFFIFLFSLEFGTSLFLLYIFWVVWAVL